MALCSTLTWSTSAPSAPSAPSSSALCCLTADNPGRWLKFSVVLLHGRYGKCSSTGAVGCPWDFGFGCVGSSRLAVSCGTSSFGTDRSCGDISSCTLGSAGRGSPVGWDGSASAPSESASHCDKNDSSRRRLTASWIAAIMAVSGPCWSDAVDPKMSVKISCSSSVKSPWIDPTRPRR